MLIHTVDDSSDYTKALLLLHSGLVSVMALLIITRPVLYDIHVQYWLLIFN